jgi:hypothetical protein
MIKRDAFWEKRNLNLNVLEIEFEESDSGQEIDIESEIKGYDYIVAKVPINQIHLVHFLEDNKFRFLEAQVDLYKKLSEGYELSDSIKRFISQTQVSHIVDDEHLGRVLYEVEQGMFETDRISLDPLFSLGISSMRYKNWISDEFKREGSELYELIYDGNGAGFFIIKGMHLPKPFLLLGGIYNKFKGLGLGICNIEKQLSMCTARGKRAVETKTSSNNVDMLKIYSKFGFTITNNSYVFRRDNINKEI